MELILDPYLQDKTLGLPYWDWSDDWSSPYPKIPNFWSDVSCDIKDSHKSDFNATFHGKTSRYAYDDTFNKPYWPYAPCPSDRHQSKISRISDEKAMKYRFSDMVTGGRGQPFKLEQDINSAKGNIDMKSFGEVLSEVHGRIHVGLGCRMFSTDTTAYDPIFFLHHSFVEKIFVDWQKQAYVTRGDKSYVPEELQSNKILAPFNNPTYKPL